MKVIGIALGMALVLGMGLLWQIDRSWRAHLVRDLESRGWRLAAQVSLHCAELSRAGLAADIPAELRHSLQESLDVVYLVLKDADGTILTEVRADEVTADARPILELTVPVGQGPHQLHVGLSTARLDSEVGWLTRRLARMTALIMLLGLVAAWWLTRLFSRPLEELVILTRAVKAGDYQVRATVRAHDEVGELAAAFNDMTEAVAIKESSRQHLLRQVIRAGEEERRRIARELHDHTGQTLTSHIAALSAMESQASDEAARQRLAELRQQTEQTLADVHDLAVDLRPSVLDDFGLMPALQRHCRLFAQRSGIQVHCPDLGLDGQRLPAEVELTVYRVVQEALTNALRHGQARRVHVLVQRTETGVLASIQDNGRGFDAHDWQSRLAGSQHLGLRGIEERVTLLGGSFCVESTPGRGAAVYAEIPHSSTA